MKPVSSIPKVAGAAGVEPPEPKTGNAIQTPMWFIALLGISLYWGTMYLDRNGGGYNPLVFNRGERMADVEARVPKSDADLLVAQGRKVYDIYCKACHQPNGRGVPNQFPPLAESDWVNVDGANRLIRIVLHGLGGPISVNGVEYNNVMLPWRDQLSDDDIAAVLTFVRGNKEWGNHSGPVTAAEVKKVREATASRDSNWTAAELLAIPLKD
ncbi:MAG: cytochrome c [Verrucomicrobia bacterium]|jgi:mono/diheme cytochrome c family protein|nr:cytochrome c [Verrucomicrobiota bacterium]